MLEKIIRSEIRAINAYHVPQSAGMVKLDAMENPYSLPEALRAEIAALAHDASINRYPDPSAAQLKQQLRDAMGISAGMDLLLGNGSDEIIQILALALHKNATLLSVEPSFVMFKMISTFCGLNYVGVPLKPDYSLDRDAILAAIQQHQPALIFIAYPNNPTGNLFDAESIAKIIRASSGLVVVDEAYYAFSPASFMPRVAEFPNLAIMRTVSKLGLAGLRLGFLVGRPDLIQELDKLRLPYNINVLTQQVACAVLKHPDVLKRQADAIVAERTRLHRALVAIPGVTAYASQANFILLRVNNGPAVFDGLKTRAILVKNLHSAHTLLANCLRVTIGTPKENQQFLTALQQSLTL
ncbi:MAG: histidinol-phosphate transaminase [Burkholderiales bacterium]